jgi:hypothetical protein
MRRWSGRRNKEKEKRTGMRRRDRRVYKKETKKESRPNYTSESPIKNGLFELG